MIAQLDSTPAPDARRAAPRPTLAAHDAQRLRALLGTRIAAAHPRHAAALASQLDRATVLPQRQVAPDVVTMNSRVVCVTAGGRRVIDLRYPWDAHASSGQISVLSELGVALLGQRVGARVATSGGRWDVLALLYQPEQEGDYHR